MCVVKKIVQNKQVASMIKAPRVFSFQNFTFENYPKR